MKPRMTFFFCIFSFLMLFTFFEGSYPFAARAEAAASSYILPDSNARYYDESELSDMSLQVVCYAKNEIYARRGRLFRSTELTGYFNEQSWYHGTIAPDQFSPSVFNEYELWNIELLNNREKFLLSGGYPVDQPGYSYLPVYNYIAGHYGTDTEEASAANTFSADFFGNAACEMITGTDPASTYLQILRSYQFNIRAYNWQAYPDMNTYPNPNPKPVAFFDLTGDGIKELLFVEAPENESGYDAVNGILHIYSWETGQAREIYRSPEYLDHAVAGGGYYVIYQNLATGGLSIFTSGGDEAWTNTLTEYILNDRGLYEAIVILEDYAYPDYDSPSYTSIHDYYRNQTVTSAEYYRAELQNSWSNHGAVLIWSDYGSVSGALNIGSLPDMAAMTFDAAVSYLSSGGEDIISASYSTGTQIDTYIWTEPSGSGDTSSLDDIYWGFMNDNQYLFTQQQSDFWYGTYDIDRDGVSELFVRYPAGVRSALQIFTYSDGQVINILPQNASYGDQILYAAEEIMEDGYDSSVCIGSTGGAAYHYNTTYVKQGNALVQQYVLFRDFSDNTYTYDDQSISETTYLSYLDPYYDADIEFVSFY